MTDITRLREIVDRFRTQEEKAGDVVNLVPSENRLSPLAQLPLSTDYYNRYFFNDVLDPEFWQFRGGQAVAEIQTELAVSCLGQLSRAAYVNELTSAGGVRTLSVRWLRSSQTRGQASAETAPAAFGFANSTAPHSTSPTSPDSTVRTEQ